MSTNISNKLDNLPNQPGVYFHKDKTGKIIYVGKAAVLRNRVRQYFQASTKKTADPKTIALIDEIADVDWITVDSEIEALFLEAEMIKRYKPRFNILERDDKADSYVRIDRKSQAPTVTLTRQPIDDGANYYGPYPSTFALKRALKYLRKAFPYSTHKTLPSRACLHYHLGLCPGPETPEYDGLVYRQNLSKLVGYLKGRHKKIINQIERDMRQAAKELNYEAAARLRNQLRALRILSSQIIFSDKENLDLSKDHALVDLQELLGLDEPPRQIEGFDISHMSGTNVVASMVVFSNGVANKSAYRKFKMSHDRNDDFANMQEALSRRFNQTNLGRWGYPDLVLIDGGKGQLSSAIEARDRAGLNLPMIGLAKKYEQVVISNASGVSLSQAKASQLGASISQTANGILVNLPLDSHLVRLLQRIRDESHRFAVSYHSTLKNRSMSKSLLDSIPGVGPVTKRKLLRHFGSVKSLAAAGESDVAKIVGDSKARVVVSAFKTHGQ